LGAKGGGRPGGTGTGRKDGGHGRQKRQKAEEEGERAMDSEGGNEGVDAAALECVVARLGGVSVVRRWTLRAGVAAAVAENMDA
jgi:hypothetical protein